MGIQQGSFSLTRYRVIGRRKKLTFQDLSQEFGHHRLKPFRLRPSRRILHYGWDYPSHITGVQASHDAWDLADCQLEEGIWLKVRIEKRNVPNQLLQLVTQSRIESEQRKRKGKVLNRKQQKAILDEVKEELLSQSLPNVSFFDVYWRDNEDMIYLFTTSKSNCSIFEELFRESFGKPLNFSLVKLVPPLLGLSKQEWQGQSSASDHRLTLLDKALPEGLQLAEP